MAERRAPRGFTFDLCPGCHQPPDGWRGRGKNDVCDTCRAALSFANRARAEQAAEGGPQVFFLPDQPHWLPYLPHGDKTRTALWTVARLIGSEATSGSYDKPDLFPSFNHSHADGRGRAGTARLIAPEIAAALTTLWRTLGEDLADAFQDGKERGTGFISQLASGEITVSKLNELTLKGRG